MGIIFSFLPFFYWKYLFYSWVQLPVLFILIILLQPYCLQIKDHKLDHKSAIKQALFFVWFSYIYFGTLCFYSYYFIIEKKEIGWRKEIIDFFSLKEFLKGLSESTFDSIKVKSIDMIWTFCEQLGKYC